MNLTTLEMQLMNNIARCEMNQNNGGVPECADDVHTYTWPDERSAAMGIGERGFGGVMSSLLQKGCIGCTLNEGDDNGIWFTDAGFEVWNADDRKDDA
tara:strand:+ start:143 stop:436 length:294 start_codon:yes stop_codon:yes gene_type:complete